MTGKLIELLRYEGRALAVEFGKASVSGRGTPQEVADFRENAFRAFVERYFPFPYRTTKGNIVDSFGNESDSIDCVILNPAHPHTIDAQRKFSAILVDATDAAIEVKPDLQSASELKRGLGQLLSVKKLVRSETPLLIEGVNPPHIVEHSKRVPAFLFTERIKVDPADTAREIADFYQTGGTPLVEQLDYVVVNNTGILANYKYPEETFSPTKQTGFFWEEWGEDTMAAFLYKLGFVIPSVATMSTPIVKRYTKQLQPRTFVKL